MSVNGTIVRYALDGLFIVLIGTFSWIANKADSKVERHETRIQATEVTNMRLETKVDYLIKSSDEMRGDLRKLMQERKP